MAVSLFEHILLFKTPCISIPFLFNSNALANMRTVMLRKGRKAALLNVRFIEKSIFGKQPEQKPFKFNKDTGKLINSPGTFTVCRIKAREKGKKANWGLDREGSCQSFSHTFCIWLCEKLSDVHLVSFKLHAGTVKMVSFLYTDLGSLRLLLLSLGSVKTDKGQTSGFLKKHGSVFFKGFCSFDVYLGILFL